MRTVPLVLVALALSGCGVESPAGLQPNAPGVDAAALDAGRQPITDTPSFTPFDNAPMVSNREYVSQLLEQEYPALLRTAGIEGRTIVWLQLDETGVVQRVTVNQTSGHAALDEAALRVARAITFSPAQLNGRPTPVWVSIPVSFQQK